VPHKCRDEKAELGNPDSVQVTGRHERLRPPMVWNTKWRTARLVIVSALVPIVVFGLMFLYFHYHPKH
jgi:hypothetical protein